MCDYNKNTQRDIHLLFKKLKTILIYTYYNWLRIRDWIKATIKHDNNTCSQGGAVLTLHRQTPVLAVGIAVLQSNLAQSILLPVYEK